MLALAAIGVAVSAVLGFQAGSGGAGGKSASASRPSASASPTPSPALVPVAVNLVTGLPPAAPVQLSIPAIGVKAPMIVTDVNADASPEVPPFDHPEEVGWFDRTVSPGERGAAVIWGHIDTRTGTAVFVNLSALTSGAQVQVTRTDGKVATFTVDRVADYPKDEFPDSYVYDDPGYPALRLITCGGSFDRKTQEYSDSTIVSARLTSVSAPLVAIPHPAPINVPIPQPSEPAPPCVKPGAARPSAGKSAGAKGAGSKGAASAPPCPMASPAKTQPPTKAPPGAKAKPSAPAPGSSKKP